MTPKGLSVASIPATDVDSADLYYTLTSTLVRPHHYYSFVII